MKPNSDELVPRLQLHGVRKSFNSPVLRGVSLVIQPGEVHALLGANGAGKSTLSRVIAGLLTPDDGTIEVDGQAQVFRRKCDAERAGIGIVQQELNLIDELTVAENIFLGRWPTRLGLISHTELVLRASAAMERIHCSRVDVSTPVRELGIGERQLVEIAAALAQDVRLLILDEPTSALSKTEVDSLFQVVRELTAHGVSVLYISHRMDEIQVLADRMTVLRDGKVELQGRVQDCPIARVIHAMTGEPSTTAETPRSDRELQHRLLRVNGLQSATGIRHVSFELHSGEILGICGLMGSGRTELLRVLFGVDRADGGTVEVEGRTSTDPIDAVPEAYRQGIRFVPEDRQSHGLLLPRSISENVSLNRWICSRWVKWIKDRASDQEVDKLITRLTIACHSSDQPVGELSGGNQQKVVFSRCLDNSARILLLDEPTRGIDIAARNTVYELMADLAKSGRGVIWVSSDWDELMEHSDRMLVLHQGRVVADFKRGEWSESLLHHYALNGQLVESGASETSSH